MRTTLLAILALAAMPAFSQQVRQIHGGFHHAAGVMHVKPTPKLVNGEFNHDTVFAQVADGGGWTTTITVTNLSRSVASPFTLYFYSNTGAEQSFTWSGPDVTPGTYSSIVGTLEPGGSFMFSTANVGTPDGTNEGYAEFVGTTDQYSTSASISGYAVFVNTANGNEATVPLEAWNQGNQLIAWNQTNGYGMGVAMVNTNPESPISLSSYVYDDRGTLLGSYPASLVICPRCHIALDFTGIFPLNLDGLRGTVFFEPNITGLVVMGIQYTPSGGFTSVHALAEEN